METKTHYLTAKAIKSKTPLWAKNVFRITLLLTSVATFVIAADTTIEPETAVRIGAYLKGLDLLIFGLSKMIGVEVKKEVE